MKKVEPTDPYPGSKPCVGCGYCCRKTPCGPAMRLYGKIIDKEATEPWRCPALVWDKTQKRYHCELCVGNSIIASAYRRELYVGAGCCSSLNSDRQNIPPPTETKPSTYTLPKEVQHLIVNMSRQFCSVDALILAIIATAHTLGTPEFKEEALRLIKGNRLSIMDDFFGDTDSLRDAEDTPAEKP